jgi:hypothetical protein
MNFASPAYEAVRTLLPAVEKIMEQLPAATVSVQLCVPSEIVTLPVGVPAPGATTLTLKLIVTACPATGGSGSPDVMLMEVLATSTM